jgi:hypothetical protein
MKKIIYTLILVAASLVSFTSCTEENVTPTTGEAPSGSASATKGA